MALVTDINIKIDESILLSLKKTKEDFVKEMLFNNALMLYRKNKLSLGKAAKLAGYDRMDFIRKLQKEGESIFDYDEETIDEIIENSKRVLKLIDS